SLARTCEWTVDFWRKQFEEDENQHPNCPCAVQATKAGQGPTWSDRKSCETWQEFVTGGCGRGHRTDVSGGKLSRPARAGDRAGRHTHRAGGFAVSNAPRANRRRSQNARLVDRAGNASSADR